MATTLDFFQGYVTASKLLPLRKLAIKERTGKPTPESQQQKATDQNKAAFSFVDAINDFQKGWKGCRQVTEVSGQKGV